MSIANRSELISAVGNWLKRDDLTSIIPDFIALAEARISRRLRVGEMITETTLSVTAGTANVAVPADYEEAAELNISGSPNTPLMVKPLTTLTGKYHNDDTGKPCVFADLGSNIRLAPVPDSGYTINLTYFAKVPALTVSNTTNWLLTSHPNIYLYGCLLEAKAYIMDDKRIGIWKGAFDDDIRELNKEYKRKRYSGSGLRQVAT